MKLKVSCENMKIEDLRIAKARNCTTCTDWLDVCHAECCSIVMLNIDPIFVRDVKDYIKIPKVCTPDMIWYYKLRGVRYVHNILYFPIKHVIPMGNKCIYFKKCELLDTDNLCKGHPDNKPNFCKNFTLETIKTNKVQGTHTSHNCLFRYKMMEENEL